MPVPTGANFFIAWAALWVAVADGALSVFEAAAPLVWCIVVVKVESPLVTVDTTSAWVGVGPALSLSLPALALVDWAGVPVVV